MKSVLLFSVAIACSLSLSVDVASGSQQANGSKDTKFKEQQLGKAKASYQQLLKEYPNSEFASRAQERLTALGG